MADLAKAGNIVTVCVGSNRQDIFMDYNNSSKVNNPSPSVFAALPALVKEVCKSAGTYK